MTLFNKVSTLIRRNKAGLAAGSSRAPADYPDLVATESVQVVVDASKHAPAGADVHVRMMFKENGDMIICEVQHFGSPSPSQGSRSPSPSPPSPALYPPASKFLSVADLKLTAASRILPQPALPGLSSSEFRMFKTLGSGSQGSVSLVQYQGDGRLYALKAMAKAAMRTSSYPLVFQEQAILKMLVGNHFFPQLRGSFEDSDNFYLLTDFCANGDLRKRMNASRFEVSQARTYAAQLVFALEQLHERRVLHRDIKPGNILITREDDLVLTDFGLSCAFGLDAEQTPWKLNDDWARRRGRPCFDATVAGSKDVTRHECGTVGYMAPETFRADVYSYPADVFSLGVVIYEMLHGKLPFGIGYHEYDPSVAYKAVMSEPVIVDEDLGIAAHDLLCKMLHKDQLQRPTIDQVKNHPWFSLVNWKELSMRRRSMPLEPRDMFQPEEDVKTVTFGVPYAEGSAPHWWYQWTSPALHRAPQDPRKQSLRKKTAKWQKPIAASPRPPSPVPAALSAAFATPATPRWSPFGPRPYGPWCAPSATLCASANTSATAVSGHSAPRSTLKLAPAKFTPSLFPSPCPPPPATAAAASAVVVSPRPALRLVSPTSSSSEYAAFVPPRGVNAGPDGSAPACPPASSSSSCSGYASLLSVECTLDSVALSVHARAAGSCGSVGESAPQWRMDADWAREACAPPPLPVAGVRPPPALQRVWRALRGVPTVRPREGPRRLDLLE